MVAFALCPTEPDGPTKGTEMGDSSAVKKGGFSYFVSDEQLEAFMLLTPLQRLKWVDDARRFTLLARTPETAERQERLRRGEYIV